MKPIAIYLPQFHPIPENDEAWGEGFTEWTNVTRAKPLYKGHYQPRLPADLGFYDLRLSETRLKQEALARKYGIYGFCYYHYWFNGKRLLHEPLDRKLRNPNEDLPFMLFWANETWSKRWLGEEREIIIKQEYSADDDANHATWLCQNVFKDKRYITIDGRPVFIFYRPNDLPDYKNTIAIYKEIAHQNNVPEPYLVGANAHSPKILDGFDNFLNFEPQLGLLPNAFNDGKSFTKWKQNMKAKVNSAKLKVYDYSEVKERMMSRKFPTNSFPCVFVSWDNTARRGEEGIIIHSQNKNDFKKSLQWAKEKVNGYKEEEQLVFINAWNEWAEGNYLEPDIKYGHQFLETVKEVFGE